jgi:hypothetical protein
VFGKKGTVTNNVYKISYSGSDLKVKVGNFLVAPGPALGTWVGNPTRMTQHTGLKLNKIAVL